MPVFQKAGFFPSRETMKPVTHNEPTAPVADTSAAQQEDANVDQSLRATGMPGASTRRSADDARLHGHIPEDGARRRAEEGPLWGSDPEDVHRAGIDA
ncbi:MAG: hypothetical protein ACRET6_00390, partial [Burkholderiales bacterium]